MSDEERPVLDYQTPGTGAQGWKTIWTAQNTFEANLAVVALQERGLHARVDAENMAPIGGMVIPAKVQVFADEVEPARKLLKEIEDERARRAQARAVVCPRCGERKSRPRIAMQRHLGTLCFIATFFTFGVQFPAGAMVTVPAMVLLWLWPLTPRWKCLNCRHHFVAPEPEAPDDEDD